MRIQEISRKKANKFDAAKVKDLLDKERKEHSKMVKGKFEFVDAQGGWIEFTYRYFPEDLLATYKFVHGEICEIPMGLVKHINNTVKKVRIFGDSNGMIPERGLPSTYSVASRIRFTPIDYI